jgi:uncharacterized protein (TIGR02246 family)
MKNNTLYKSGRKSIGFSGLLFATFVAFTACEQQTDRSELKSRIEQANQEWMEAVQQGNADGVADMYTDDAFLLPSNTPAIQGREGVKSFFSGAMNSGIKRVKLVTEEVEGDGESAIERGTYEMMIDGDKVVDKGKYIVHWRHLDGKWKLHKDMFNSDLPAALPAFKEGNFVSLHVASVKLNRGVRLDQFLDFYKNTIIPEYAKNWPDAKIYVVKGVRGEDKNRAGFIYYFESEAIRNKYFNDDGSPTAVGNSVLEKMKPTFDQMEKLYGTETTTYTDWIIQ